MSDGIIRYPEMIERNTRHAATDISEIRKTVSDLQGRVFALEAEQRKLLDDLRQFQSYQRGQKDHDDAQRVKDQRKSYLFAVVVAILSWALGKYF